MYQISFVIEHVLVPFSIVRLYKQTILDNFSFLLLLVSKFSLISFKSLCSVVSDLWPKYNVGCYISKSALAETLFLAIMEHGALFMQQCGLVSHLQALILVSC